jgi:hypothetical protein
MAISDGTNAPSASAYVNAQRRLDPAKYVDLGSFIKDVNKPDNRELLVKTYGNQGITGFLQLTGAVKAAGNADAVQWWEEQRLHPRAKFTPTVAKTSNAAGAEIEVTVAATDADPASSAASLLVRAQDVLLMGDVRVLVTSVTKSTANKNAISKFTVKPLVSTESVPDLTATAKEFPIIGNLFAQGTDQQTEYLESNVVKYTNPYMIVKEIYKVTGSQATNIGWINLGNGDYRWYVKSESDTRQRFMDKREMMMLMGQKADNIAGIDGSEGYFSAIEDRGIVHGGYIESISDVDALVKELDRQGASPEYALYVNRHQALKIDDMLASGNTAGNALTTGVMSQFGAFNNSKDMALELGFQSFSRGGYTFHKHDWKLLNDPTLLGSSTAAGANFIGAAVPMSTVVDAQSGDRNPSLEMNYKATNGYSREMEHWMTGSILGASNDTKDLVQFNYRSEISLVTRAANRHVLIKDGSLTA